MSARQLVLILEYGSQYTQLIARRVREAGVYSEIAPFQSADEAFDRSIDVHISRLRQKLGDDPRNPRLLRTIRGVGYLLSPGE